MPGRICLCSGMYGNKIKAVCSQDHVLAVTDQQQAYLDLDNRIIEAESKRELRELYRGVVRFVFMNKGLILAIWPSVDREFSIKDGEPTQSLRLIEKTTELLQWLEKTFEGQFKDYSHHREIVLAGYLQLLPKNDFNLIFDAQGVAKRPIYNCRPLFCLRYPVYWDPETDIKKETEFPPPSEYKDRDKHSLPELQPLNYGGQETAQSCFAHQHSLYS
ncbi:hypothetical protein BJY04DRAFT_225015 [Aspergillus karnatakaensis]|uniref:uncharacterized protein n=1 Tax=Aspergillus karnatakaensis TaxID=1810916 RepID=UPI003CCD8C5B